MTKNSRPFIVLIVTTFLVSTAFIVATADNNSVVYNAVENKRGTITVNQALTYTVWLPSFMKNWCSVYIEFTYVPPFGSFQDLQGRANCVTPANYKVVVYIYVFNGWWNKPYWDHPLTPIQANGSFTTDITTDSNGGTDACAVKIVAFLIPNSYSPPTRQGEADLPPELYTNAVAYTTANRNGTCP